jgi:hypothetical protein
MSARPKPFTVPQRVSSTATVPAPVGGLNAYDSIANMPETDAIIMRNFYPEAYGVRVRRGYKEHAIGLNGDVGTLMQYYGVTGSPTIFAVDQTQVMDITATGDYSAGTPICASAYPWWQYTNMGNASGNHMIAFNGVDDGIVFDGTGLHRLVAGDGTTVDTWSGVDPQDLVVPVVHQHRLWAVEKDSTRGWYLPPDQYYGVAVSFDFGANFSRGGFLQTLITYTQDSGYGPDDYLAGISSAGELVLYKGTDPGTATTWGLVGVFYIGATFTRRCASRFGGDVAILTQYGMITIGSIAKPTDVTVLDNALSRKIQPVISEVVSEGSARLGWAMLLYPNANMQVINVPGIIPSQTLQLVYNTLTKAWGLFEGMPAVSWMSVNDSLMFGATGKVYRAWEGGLDNVDLQGNNGIPVYAECQQSFNYFSMRGANKHFKLFRPVLMFRGGFKYRAGANMDFDLNSLPPPASFSTSNYGIWNTAIWDLHDVWSGGAQTDKQWVSIVGIGYAAAIRIGIYTQSDVIWASTDWVFEKGGVV